MSCTDAKPILENNNRGVYQVVVLLTDGRYGMKMIMDDSRLCNINALVDLI